MNCNESIERLPWFLNGTLESGEHDEVRRHLATCESCRAALNDTREAWTIFDQHLSSEALVALAYGEAPPGIDPELAERHLASCPHCAAELELARTSRHLEEDETIALFPGTRPLKSERDGSSRTWRTAALAASLAAVVTGAGLVYELQRVSSPTPASVAQKPAQSQPAPGGGDVALRSQNAQLRNEMEASQKRQDLLQGQLDQAKGQLAELDHKYGAFLKPQINTWSEQVENRDVVRDGETQAHEIVIPANRYATPLLEASHDNDKLPREVEIVDGQGNKLWEASGLKATPQGDYRITIPPGFLAPGHYAMKLYARASGRRVPRESYPIRVE